MLYLNDIGRFFKRNGSTMLTIGSGICTVSSIISLIKEIPEANERIEQEKIRLNKKHLNIFETLRAVFPVCWPAMIFGVASIGLSFSSNVLNKNEQRELVAAYVLLDQYHKQYKNKIIEKEGLEYSQQIEAEIATIYKKKANTHYRKVYSPDMKVMFYDPYLDFYYERYERELLDAEYHINRNYILGAGISENEIREFLDLPKLTVDNYGINGDEIGFTFQSGLCWIDFIHRELPDEPGVFVIETEYPPMFLKELADDISSCKECPYPSEDQAISVVEDLRE